MSVACIADLCCVTFRPQAALVPLLVVIAHLFLLLLVLSAAFGIGPGASGRKGYTNTLLLVGAPGSGKSTLFYKL
jgi:hypothetical protein